MIREGLEANATYLALLGRKIRTLYRRLAMLRADRNLLILKLLADDHRRPKPGLELVRKSEGMLGRATIYIHLARLEREGLIKPIYSDRRTRWHLTESGERIVGYFRPTTPEEDDEFTAIEQLRNADLVDFETSPSTMHLYPIEERDYHRGLPRHTEDDEPCGSVKES